MDETKFSETYSNIFMIFSKGGGFFIDPIYINNGTQKNIIVLPFDKIKKGVNILDVCLQE